MFRSANSLLAINFHNIFADMPKNMKRKTFLLKLHYILVNMNQFHRTKHSLIELSSSHGFRISSKISLTYSLLTLQRLLQRHFKVNTQLHMFVKNTKSIYCVRGGREIPLISVYLPHTCTHPRDLFWLNWACAFDSLVKVCARAMNKTVSK
jgi:hypothetical protein